MPQDQVKIKRDSSSHNTVTGSDSNHYPYGTSLNLHDELIEELGVENLAVGDIVEVRGFAYVESTLEHTDTDNSSKSVSLQMTTMKIQRETSDRAEQLYGPKS